MLRLERFSRLIASLRQRGAGVAVIVALMTPVLIAMTGLSVGVGTWYQQQASLQNAADAAALAAGLNDATFGQTTATAKQSAAAATATAAADTATGGNFGFAAGTGGASLTLTVPSTSPVKYTAVARIPRTSFFTKGAAGMFGIGAGFQYATATVALKAASTAPACILATDTAAQQAVFASGGARVTASNCAVMANSSACNANNGDADAIAVDPSAQVVASAVSSVGCIYANTNGQAYVGGPNGDTSVINQHAPAVVDPLAAMGNPPPWPQMPNTPVPVPGTSYTPAPSLGYNVYSGPPGDCTYMGNYSANCELPQGNYSGLNNVGVNSLLLNEATSTGTTYISGGLTVNANNFLTLNANKYDIAGGMSLTTSGTGALAAGSYNILGGTTLTNGGYTIGAGTSYFSGAATATGAATTWGMNLNTPSLGIGAGTYYFNGGMYIGGSNPRVTFGQGLYLFSSYSGNSAGAFDDSNSTSMTFTGGTYFFDGGLTIGGNATVTFGPGIYYVRNGNLTFSNGSTVNANGATFVLEGNASYQMDGGTVALNLTAPSSNCVAPFSYPLAAYTLPSSNTTLPNGAAPYDGTNGQGICGILVYQARGDATADGIIEGATSTVTGIFYAPSAALAVSGGASISAAASGSNPATLAFIQDTFSLTGSGAINVSLAANSILNTGGGSGAAQALLIQ